MGSYFVVLHSTPEGGGPTRRKFVLELAKRLGRKEQDIDILLSDLPAVVTASPTKDFAVALCLAIENLGGLAETMSEVSGVHMALGPGGEKPAFNKKEPPSPVKEKPAAPLKPVETLDLSLSFDTPAPANEVVSPLLGEHSPESPDFQPPAIEDISQLLDDVLAADSNDPILMSEPPPPKETLAPIEKSKSPGKKVQKQAAPKTESAPTSEDDKDAPKKTKSKSTLSVISAFAQKDVSLSKKSKAPRNDEVAEPEAPAPRRKPIALEIENQNGEFDIPQVTAPNIRKPLTTSQTCLYGLLVVALLAYIAVLIHPEFILGTQEKEVTVNIANIKTLLKQQDKILEDINTKQVSDAPKVYRDWSTDEISGQGSLTLTLGSADRVFDSGTIVLTTPPAAKLTPEEYSRGVTPRIWIKELVVEKLRKTGKPEELAGKAKLTIADERSLDKIVASVVVSVQMQEGTDVATGTVEVFFPSVTAERPPSDIVQKEAIGGLVRIYHRRDFTTRVNPTPDKTAAPTRPAKAGKGKAKAESILIPVI